MQIPNEDRGPATALACEGAFPVVQGALDGDRLAWLALVLTPGLGPKRIVDAMAQLDAPSEIFSLPLTGIEALRFPAQAAQFIFDGKARAAAELFAEGRLKRASPALRRTRRRR